MPQENTDMAPAQTQQQPVAGYRVLAVIAFLVAVGGLFAGLLGRIFPWVTVTGSGPLAGSLLGYLIEYFGGMFADFAAFHVGLFSAGDLLPVIEYAAVALFCLTLPVSLILMLVALFSRKGAKGCAISSAIFVFLSNSAFFVLWFCALTLAGSAIALPSVGGFDMGTGCLALVMLLALFVVDLLQKRSGAFLDLGCMLLLFATIFALTYPGSVLLKADVNYMRLGQDAFVNVTAFVAAMLVIISLLAATIRMGAKRSHVFDSILYALLFAADLVFVIALGVRYGAAEIFSAASLLPVILAIVAPLSAFLLKLIAAIWQHAKQTRTREQPAAPIVQRQPAPAPAAPTPVAEPQPQTQQPVATPVYPMPFFAMPMPVAQPQPVSAPAAEPTPAPPPAPATVEEVPVSAFERDMIALANAPATDTQNTTSTTYPYAAAYQTAPPQPSGITSQPPLHQGAPLPSYMGISQPAPVYDPTPYIYDAFISSLTPQEKNEFGNLFIDNRHGDLSYLPAYIIGGDNKEFFNKIFVYLGKFRDHISAPLLNKLYLYVSSR